MQTRLLYAAKYADYASLLASIEDKCDLEARDESGRTALSVACSYSPQCALALIEARCDINTRSNGGWNPILFACMQKHTEVVKSLLIARCEVNARSNHGWSVLENVISFRWMEDLQHRETQTLDRYITLLISAGCEWRNEDVLRWPGVRDLFDDVRNETQRSVRALKEEKIFPESIVQLTASFLPCYDIIF